MYTVSLEAARVNVKLNQKQAAKEIGVNTGTLSNWERGKTAPDIEKFMRMCEVYGCPSDMMRLT